MTLLMEIMALILARLPVKSLLQFKAVCKDWRSLISSRYFIYLHLELFNGSGKSINSLLVAEHENFLECRALDSNLTPISKTLLPPPFDIKNGYFRVCGSCNGLVILDFYDFCNTSEYGITKREVIIWNPSIKSFFVLPYAEVPESFLVYCYGFGYDRSKDDYKLVRFVYDQDNLRQTLVYSLKQNCWGTPLIEDTCYVEHWSCKGALIDGHIIHWILCNSINGDDNFQLRGFDVCSEEWRDLPFPDFGGDHHEVEDLGVLDDCLCLLSRTFSNSDDMVYVWAMKEYGARESWAKLFCLSGVLVSRLIGPPVAYTKGDKEVLIEIVNRNDYWSWYNLGDKTIIAAGHCKCLALSLCVPSLVPASGKME